VRNLTFKLAEKNPARKAKGPATFGRASINDPEKRENRPPRSGLVQRQISGTPSAA
jgi:hypothetical protein